MNEIIFDYLADKIIEDMRKRRLFQRQFYRLINEFPLLAHLRRNIKKQDYNRIKYL
jgi:hypothetical protein